MANILHITNGDILNDRLLNLQIKGDFAVWREMLCEGKTVTDIASDEFIKSRLKFFAKDYKITEESYRHSFGSQLAIISDAQKYDEVVLWFEYDLFCHINMIACLSYLNSIVYNGTIHLVCSGWIENETELKSLAQLTDQQLLAHYAGKITLSNNDVFLAHTIWKQYCGDDHTKLQPKLALDSGFKYLSNCISAHKERFPEKVTGLNTLETNLLKLIRKYKIKTEHQLCGYLLNYQGYYGYGDIQFFKMIERMRPFFTKDGESIVLTSTSNAILDEGKNVRSKIKYKCVLGGVDKYNYDYNALTHQITKH